VFPQLERRCTVLFLSSRNAAPRSAAFHIWLRPLYPKNVCRLQRILSEIHFITFSQLAGSGTASAIFTLCTRGIVHEAKISLPASFHLAVYSLPRDYHSSTQLCRAGNCPRIRSSTHREIHALQRSPHSAIGRHHPQGGYYFFSLLIPRKPLHHRVHERRCFPSRLRS
jgi:hypothetical protein